MKKKVLLENKTNANLLESYMPIANNSSVIGSFKVKGMIVEDTISKNRTKYPKGAWLSEGALAKGGRFIDRTGKLIPSKLMGSLDHPDDGHVEMKLKEACVIWNDIQRNPGGTWDGEAHILNNEHGKALKTILDYVKEFGGGDMIGVSSRSVGNVEQKTDEYGNYYESVIPGTLELKSFDVVYEPSFGGAQILQESTKALGKQKVLFESIRALGEEDEEHKEYYDNLAKDLENKFSKEGENMKTTTDFIKTCPLCGKEYKGYPAISRVDNQTPICPTCGTRQALEGLGLKPDEIEKIILEITKEFIVENINQALQFNGYELDKQELILLDKVVEKHYDDIACWGYKDYHYFAKSVSWKNFICALEQFDLIDRNDLDFLSEVITNLEEASKIEELTSMLEETAKEDLPEGEEVLEDITEEEADKAKKEDKEDSKEDEKTEENEETEEDEDIEDKPKTVEEKLDEVIDILFMQGEEITSIKGLVEDLTMNYDFNDVDEIEVEEELEDIDNLEDQPEDEDFEETEEADSLESISREELELLSDEELEEILESLGE